MGELTEDLDLTHDLFGVVFVLEDIVDELDGNLLASVAMLGLDNFSVATGTNELDELVVFEGVLPDWCEGHLS